MKLINTLKHFHLVNKHRFYVFKLACMAGIPFRGLIHDLSKYSYDEFWISCKYYDGKRSPLKVARDKIGYSTAWCHHKGRNKHHFEYWEDSSSDKRIGIFIPYKYIVESICDKVAAGMAYRGKEWSQHEPLDYWKKIDRENVIVKHPESVEFVDIVLEKISNYGLKKTMKRNYLKKLYNDICIKYNICR